MPKITDMFPSRWLRCADLQGRRIAVTIDRVDQEDLGDGAKPVAYFQGKEKGLVLNRTNATIIADLLGDETDNWSGKRICLVPAKTQFQGKLVDCIRIEPAPRAQSQQRQPPPPPVEEPPEPETDDDSDLPF